MLPKTSKRYNINIIKHTNLLLGKEFENEDDINDICFYIDSRIHKFFRYGIEKFVTK